LAVLSRQVDWRDRASGRISSIPKDNKRQQKTTEQNNKDNK